MSRGDRDSFIRINLQNIIDPVNNFYNFANFASEIESNNLGIQYDLSSIMHYDSTVSNIDALLFDSDILFLKAYGINGSQTMQSLDPNLQFLMGQRAGLSFYDIKMACIAYNCSGLKEDFIKVLRNIKLYYSDLYINPPICQNDGFISNNCKCTCPNGVFGINCQYIVSNSMSN